MPQTGGQPRAFAVRRRGPAGRRARQLPWPLLVTAAVALAPADWAAAQGPQLLPGWPVILGNGILAAPAVADLDGDGRDELAVGLRDGRVFLLDGDGRVLAGWPRATDNQVWHSPLLHDLDGDGTPEVLAASADRRLHAWSRSGERCAGWPVALPDIPATGPQLGHGSRDAAPTIVVGCADGTIHQFHASGSPAPGWPVAGGAVRRHVAEVQPLAIADLDRDGASEILWLSRNPTALRVWSMDGGRRPDWERTFPGEGLGVTVGHWPEAPVVLITTLTEVWVGPPAGPALFTASAPAEDEFTCPATLIPGPRFGHPDEALVALGTSRGSLDLRDRAGRSAPGWPRDLGGFVFGMAGQQERFIIRSAPLALDLDADGTRELVVSSYDQHLYGLEFDGTALPGWPVTLDDAVVAPAVTAELDGAPGVEIVAGQVGESLYAFGLVPDDGIPGPTAPAATSGPGPVRLVLAAAALSALAALALTLTSGRRPRAGARPAPRRLGWLGWLVLLVALSRGVVLLVDLRAGAAVRADLRALDEVVAAVFAREGAAATALARTLAAGCDSLAGDREPSLYALERLADRARLDYAHTGLMLTDTQGRAVVSLGLARGRDGAASRGAASPVMLVGPTPVVAAAAELPRRPQYRLLAQRSLTEAFPQKIADATGCAAWLRLDGAVLAGASTLAAPRDRGILWLRPPVPVRDIRLAEIGPGRHLSVRLRPVDGRGPARPWLDLCLAAAVGLGLGLRWSRTGLAGLGRGRFLVGAALWLAGRLALGSGAAASEAAALAAYGLELALVVAGLAGLVAGLRHLSGPGHGRRLGFALLASYLVVALLPLSMALLISMSLLQRAQRGILDGTLADLAQRADNILMAYMGSTVFRAELAEVSGRLMDQSEETGWFNFVGEDQYLFTYDLPTAYATLAAWDPAQADRRFSGYSYRAPRHRKFFQQHPEWTREEPWRGVVLEQGVPEVRAGRTLRTGDVTVQLTCHVPLDGELMRRLEHKLRILPFLPEVRLAPAWPLAPGGIARPAGRELPVHSGLVIPARDWRTGSARWVPLAAHATLPAGSESATVILTLIALAMLPLGLSAWGVWFTMRRTVRPLSQLLRGIRRVGQGDLEFRLGDSGSSEIAVTSRAFDQMAGSLQHTVGELAEKKKVEEVSALKSRFISMVSHDLKTPLAAIQGAAENVLAGVTGPATPDQSRYLQMILSSSRHLQEMITNLLDLSRLESGGLVLETESLDVRREVEAVVRSLGPLLERESLVIRVESPPGPLPVAADRTRLWQILGNLLANALRYSPRGGVVVVAIRTTDQVARDGRSCLLVAVRDQGPGIPEADRQRVLEPFATGSLAARVGRGAGLGLAIVDQLVALHGGRLRIGDAPGGGASLEFTLPRPD